MKKFIIPAVLILLLLVLVGFKVVQKTTSTAKEKDQATKARNAPAVVQLATAGPQRINNSIDAVGSLESPFTVKLSPNVAGRIDYLEVREGDRVQKGQVLARIDPAEVEGEILQYQSALAEAQQKLSQARITENANTVGIYSTINQNEAGVASSDADYNEVVATYEATVGAAHEATVDAQSKVRAAESNIRTSEANEKLAEANLEDSKAKYTREYNLYKQGFVAPQDVDDSRAAEKVNEAQVNAGQRTVDASKSAYVSAEAEYKAAAEQEDIARKKGQSDIRDAKAKLTQSKATLGTAVANKAQIPAYTENLRALYSEVVAAKANLNQAIARRSYLIVKSSIDGTVTQRLADPGAEATPGSQILVIQYLQWLFVTATVPVEYSEQVKPGLEVALTLDAFPGKKFHSQIVDVNKSADPSSRQFMIRLKLENENLMFRPGMYARLNMVTSVTDAAVAVPREAVTTDASNNSTVTIVDSGLVAHVVPVTLGDQDSNYIQILSGVKAGDKVNVLSYRPIKDGAKVTLGSAGGKGGHGKKGQSSSSITATPSDHGASTGGGAPASTSGAPSATTGGGGTSGASAPSSSASPGAVGTNGGSAPGGSSGLGGTANSSAPAAGGAGTTGGSAPGAGTAAGGGMAGAAGAGGG